jgi:bifunctional DNA-binding transcriptional regulator/antitoxin component of YhaV-PrlF toxin-antitoxin module
MQTSLSTTGQIILPAELLEQDNLKPGQQFSIERVHSGEYLIKRTNKVSQNGLVDLLLACPEKDWFVPLPSESTDTIKADLF